MPVAATLTACKTRLQTSNVRSVNVTLSGSSPGKMGISGLARATVAQTLTETVEEALPALHLSLPLNLTPLNSTPPQPPRRKRPQKLKPLPVPLTGLVMMLLPSIGAWLTQLPMERDR